MEGKRREHWDETAQLWLEHTSWRIETETHLSDVVYESAR